MSKDTRECQVTERDCAFTCERFDGLYQLFGSVRLLVPEYALLIELFIKLHRMFSALLQEMFERALSLLATFLALTMSLNRDNTKASLHLM